MSASVTKERAATGWPGALIYLLAAIAVASWFGWTWLHTPLSTTVRNLAPGEDEYVRQAMSYYLEHLQWLATTAVGLAGLVWAFLLKDEYRVRVRGLGGFSVFLMVNLVLLASYYCYSANRDLLLSDLYSLPPSFDLFAPVRICYEEAQQVFLVLGAVGLGVLVLVSRTNDERKC